MKERRACSWSQVRAVEPCQQLPATQRCRLACGGGASPAPETRATHEEVLCHICDPYSSSGSKAPCAVDSQEGLAVGSRVARPSALRRPQQPAWHYSIDVIEQGRLVFAPAQPRSSPWPIYGVVTWLPAPLQLCSQSGFPRQMARSVEQAAVREILERKGCRRNA